MQLEYCLREPLSKFVGLSIYFLLQLYKREHFVLHIWDIRPIPTIRTTVRIIYLSIESITTQVEIVLLLLLIHALVHAGYNRKALT